MKYLFDKYYKKTKGYYPFFKYCPKIYRDYYFKKRAYDVLGYNYYPENPKTLNEKIRWLIYNEKLELKTKLTDKILVKSYAAEKLGVHHCAELYGIYNNFDEIDFSILPEKFALKANHGWKMNIIAADKRFIYKNIKKIKETTDRWLKINYELFSLEPQYRNIKHKLFVEEFKTSGYIAKRSNDISVHCFNGVPQFIEISFFARDAKYYQFYDTSWRLQDFTYEFEFINIKQEAPLKLEEILSAAKILSADFSYVRVDFTYDNYSVYLREMTFTPCSALINFHNKEIDLMLGGMLSIPKERSCV